MLSSQNKSGVGWGNDVDVFVIWFGRMINVPVSVCQLNTKKEETEPSLICCFSVDLISTTDACSSHRSVNQSGWYGFNADVAIETYSEMKSHLLLEFDQI